LIMVTFKDILNEFKKLEPTFLWRGQWISADEWTKYIKAAKGMDKVNVKEVNRSLAKISATVGPTVASTAQPRLFVNERRVDTQVEQNNDDGNDTVSFVTKIRKAQFYYTCRQIKRTFHHVQQITKSKVAAIALNEAVTTKTTKNSNKEIVHG
jgi:hypothetical protein